jgi:hypothetical protein
MQLQLQMAAPQPLLRVLATASSQSRGPGLQHCRSRLLAAPVLLLLLLLPLQLGCCQ